MYIGTFLFMLVAAAALSRIFPESTQNVEQAFGEILDHPFILQNQKLIYQSSAKGASHGYRSSQIQDQ